MHNLYGMHACMASTQDACKAQSMQTMFGVVLLQVHMELRGSQLTLYPSKAVAQETLRVRGGAA